MSGETLHFSFDDVNRVVRHGGAETGEATSTEVAQPLDSDVLRQFAVGIFEHNEAYSLVG